MHCHSDHAFPTFADNWRECVWSHILRQLLAESSTCGSILVCRRAGPATLHAAVHVLRDTVCALPGRGTCRWYAGVVNFDLVDLYLDSDQNRHEKIGAEASKSCRNRSGVKPAVLKLRGKVSAETSRGEADGSVRSRLQFNSVCWFRCKFNSVCWLLGASRSCVDCCHALHFKLRMMSLAR